MAGKSWCRMLLVVAAALFAWTSAPAVAAGSCGGPKSKDDCTKKAGCFWNGKACAVKAAASTTKSPAKGNGKTAAAPAKGSKAAAKPATAKAGKGAAKGAASKPATAAKKPAEPAKAAEPAAKPADAPVDAAEPVDTGDMPAGEEDGATEDAPEGTEDF